MTNSAETGNYPPSRSLSHCPQCGKELHSGASAGTYECPACEYTEQEVMV